MTPADVKVPFLKGDRIRAAWLEAKTSGFSLAGVQTKFLASGKEVTGTVRHIRGDHPTEPTVIRVYLDPDGEWTGPLTQVEGCTCGHPHIELKPEWVQEVL